MIFAPDQLELSATAIPNKLTTEVPSPGSVATPISQAKLAPRITTEYTDNLIPKGSPSTPSVGYGYTPPYPVTPVPDFHMVNESSGVGAQTLPTVTTWANHLPSNWQFLAVIALGIAAVVWILHRR